MTTKARAGKAAASTKAPEKEKAKPTKASPAKPAKPAKSVTKSAPAAKAKPKATEDGSAAASRVAALEQALDAALRARGDADAALEEAHLRMADLVRHTDDLAARLATVPSRDAPAAAGTLVCPRCGDRMDEILHLGVTIDRCNGCGGLFFDGGELEEVIRREYPEPDIITVVVPETVLAAAAAEASDTAPQAAVVETAETASWMTVETDPVAVETEAVPQEIEQEITAKGQKGETRPPEGEPPAAAPPLKRGFFRSLFSRKPKGDTPTES